jgi:hypothetical protein
MATEIGGLFTTPEQYQQALQQQAYDRAVQMESLPWGAGEKIAANVGGYQLGGVIGRALGGEDPQLKLISQRQQILGMIDPTNPDTYPQAIQAALQAGDTQAAYLLRNEMMKVKQQAQEEQLQGYKLTDYLTQRGLGMQSQGLTNMANELVGQLINPDKTINEEVKAKLLSFPQGRAAISEQAKVIPDLRKLGAAGVPEEDPFKIFSQDPTIPANVKTLASQYSSSFSKGIIDPEKVDTKVRELTDMTQRIQQFEQNQQQIKANQDMMAGFREQGLENSAAYLRLAQNQAKLTEAQNSFNQQMRLDEAARKREQDQQKQEEKANKPLRPDLAKDEEADYLKASEARNLATDAYDYVNKIKSGEIKFGLKDRASIAARSALGSNDPDIIARNDFERFKTRLVNESLRLNKGTQTEGDAQRSIKELQSAESAVDAAKAVNTLAELNARKVSDAQKSIERRRINANSKLPEVPIETLKFEPHTFTQRDVDAFLKNPKYPSGSIFVDPQGTRRVKP